MKRLVQISFLIAIATIFFPSLQPLMGAAQSKRAPGPQVRSEMLVSTDWLAKHINDRDVFVIHIAADRKNYDEGHLPGARFLPSKELVTTRNGVANELPAVADLQKVFELLGVGDTGRIVIYGESAGLLAARAYFTLDYLGHGARAALLDGGIEKWKIEKLLVDTEPVNPAPAKFTPRPHPQIVAKLDVMRDLSWVATHVPEGGIALVDSRSEEQYIGAQSPRSGHIPGAFNLYWLTHLTSRDIPAMKPADELRKIYEALGLNTGQKVVTYCNSGMQSSHTYFTLKYLGYDVMMYDGSFSEWSKADAAPVANGKEKASEKKQ